MPHTQDTPTAHAVAEPALGATLAQVLRNPLCALRASIESLAGEFRADDPRALSLRGALDQVLSMSRDVEALVNYAAPRSVAPLFCSTEEILRSALRGLGFEAAGRIKLANSAPDSRLHVDGPLLSECLGLLLHNALLREPESLLLCAARESDATLFSIVEIDVGEAQGNALDKRGASGAQLSGELARRDIERLGGNLRVERTALGHQRVVVRLPDARTPLESAQVEPPRPHVEARAVR